MNEIIHKYVERILAGATAFLLCFSSLSVPVNADTTYYSYNYYGLRNDGTVIGINLNVSTVHPVVYSINYNNHVSYYMAFCLYASGFSTRNEANSYATLYARLSGVSKSTDNSASTSWTYSNVGTGDINIGSFTNSAGNTVYYYYSVILPFQGNLLESSPSSANTFGGFGVYCFGNTDLWTYSGGSAQYSTTMTYNYAMYKITGNMPTDYYIATVPAKTWLKNSESITPAINDSLLSGGNGSASDSGGNAGPATPTPDPGGSGSGSGSGGSMSQTQSIASGAVAFTVEDGAFSQTQSQTIESDAINVTVNNNNDLNQDNVQYIDQVINNNLGTNGNTFDQAIGNISGFTAIARNFAGLAGAVLGFLPSWVLSLIALAFSILLVMIVFRLIHLFI